MQPRMRLMNRNTLGEKNVKKYGDKKIVTNKFVMLTKVVVTIFFLQNCPEFFLVINKKILKTNFSDKKNMVTKIMGQQILF